MSIISVVDERVTVNTRLIAVGDIFVSPGVASGFPVMIVAVGTSYGIFDIGNAAVLFSGPTILDCLNYYGITDISKISYIIPGENADMHLIGSSDAGSNIKLPTV